MYRTISQLDAVVSTLATNYPQLCSQVVLPEPSVQGRPVHALQLRAGGGQNRRGVLLVGGTHARELMNPDLLIELAVDLVASYLTGKDVILGGRVWPAADIRLIMESIDLFLLPCVNPDGRHYVMTVDGLWRKNRRDNPGTACDGVDLNRNADLLWGVTEGQTSCNPCSDVYCGPSVFSEPETRNVRHLLDSHGIDCFADVHSYSELVLHPWGHAPTQTTETPAKRFTTLPVTACQPITAPNYAEYMTPRDLLRFESVGDRDCPGHCRRTRPEIHPGIRARPVSHHGDTERLRLRAPHCGQRPSQDLRLHARDRPVAGKRGGILPPCRSGTGQAGGRIGAAGADPAVHLRHRADRLEAAWPRHGGPCTAPDQGRTRRHGGRTGLDRTV